MFTAQKSLSESKHDLSAFGHRDTRLTHLIDADSLQGVICSNANISSTNGLRGPCAVAVALLQHLKVERQQDEALQSHACCKGQHAGMSACMRLYRWLANTACSSQHWHMHSWDKTPPADLMMSGAGQPELRAEVDNCFLGGIYHPAVKPHGRTLAVA